MVAHMDRSSKEYESILGTDALRSVKGLVRMNGREWRVRLGKFRYRPEGKVLEKEVRNLLAQGIIRKSVSPYCSPLWVVSQTPDAQGTPRYRVVVDFKELKKYTRPEKYPLPRLEEMLYRMSGATVFSLLDLKAEYHQIRMHEADCEKTVWEREYEFTRMPFGLRNAPTTFQGLIDKFLEGLNDDAIQVYMDDIIVFSRSEEEHERHLGQLLHRLKEFGLKASCEMSSFFNASAKFLGHGSTTGKVVAIKQLQEPVDVKGVRSIMGLIGYYRRFLPSPADRMEGWNSLTKKGAKFMITEDMREALEWAKARLCEDPVLRFPNLSLPFVITTDPSQVAVGAVLSQFQIKTDHKPLAWVKGLRETSARITRWKERLAPYYWLGMERTVEEQLALCAVCARAKYLRISEEPPHTRNSGVGPGEEVPKLPGAGALEEFHIRIHWTTPGHPRSHGIIKRLHSTLLEHLHLLLIGRGIDGDEAWARALLAYNSFVHSATGRTPLELMRSWQQTDPPVSVIDECEGLVEADERRKNDRLDRANEKATDRRDRVRVGDHVFLRNWYRRRKSDPRFVGLYVVVSKLSRFRLRVRDSSSGRTRLVHVRETRPPSARRRVQYRDPAIGRVNSDSATRNPINQLVIAMDKKIKKVGPMNKVCRRLFCMLRWVIDLIIDLAFYWKYRNITPLKLPPVKEPFLNDSAVTLADKIRTRTLFSYQAES
ncbi:hypothetical protein AAG570_014142 [Ranatra chinensis]|uniref:Integrase catalytic domain-containing protein n=1 Tax=Ranatra chinensis TaxID=642074 RepID=A0ABD0Y586_9HEMI